MADVQTQTTNNAIPYELKAEMFAGLYNPTKLERAKVGVLTLPDAMLTPSLRVFKYTGRWVEAPDAQKK